MTAHAIKGDRERCLAAGMDHYVTKPIDPRRLFSAINEVLSGAYGVPASAGSPVPSPDNVIPAEAGTPYSRVDRDVLFARVDGDRHLLKDIVLLFLEDTPKLIQELRQSIAEGDVQRMSRTAHTLKGAVGNFGAARASELTRAIETAIRQGDLSSTSELFPQLDAELAALFPELSDIIAEDAA